jgi:hypothetical protein
LENFTVIWEFERSLVNNSIVIIGSDDVAGSTAFVCSGAVCVTGNTVAGKIIDGVPELITVVCDVVSWGSNVKVAFQAQHGDSEVLSGGGDIKVCHEFVINIGMCFDGSLVRECFKRPPFIRL